MWRIVAVLALAVISILLNGPGVNGAKILGAFPTPSRSNMVVASALMKGLADKGHQVTVLSSFPLEKPVKNYRDVTVKTDNLLQGGVGGLFDRHTTSSDTTTEHFCGTI